MKYLLALTTLLPLWAYGQKFSEFSTLLAPRQNDTVQFPSSTHAFQHIISAGEPLTMGGTKGAQSDFTGYVPINGSSRHGYLCINSESFSFGLTGSGGVCILEIKYDSTEKAWKTLNSRNVNFGALNGTLANCSGAVTPWGTVISCEELKVALDGNGDGYHDFGWCVEIDPATATVIDQDGDGKPDKLWKFGSMAHENVSIPYDSLTYYYGEDNTLTGQDNFVYKFVADEKMKLGSGKLYALKKTGETTGEWVQIPNNTKAECNNTIQLAKNAGAWYLPRVEDVEFNPVDGKVYVASTDLNQVIRFKDDGATVSEIEVYLDNLDYEIAPGIVATFTKPDNLTFDKDGNLYVLQDGGFNYIWFVDKNHTPQNPKVSIFACVPRNAEPTGLTFTPDGMFGFWSVQHPSEALNAIQIDAAGKEVKYNRDVTMVMALKEHLGTGATARAQPKPAIVASLGAFPNPVSDELTLVVESLKSVEATIEVCASVGTTVRTFKHKLVPGTNEIIIPFSDYPRDLYYLVVRAEKDAVSTKVLKSEERK